MATTGASGSPPSPLDERHRAAACFYGVLSVLQRPLVQFLATRCAQVAAEHPQDEPSPQAVRTLLHAASRKQLEFLRDRWASHLRTEELPIVLDDIRVLLQVQSQGYYSPNVGTTTFLRGVDAAIRLVAAFGADAATQRQAEAFQRMLLTSWTDVGNESVAIGDEPTDKVADDQGPSDSSVPTSSTRSVRPLAATEERTGAQKRKSLVGEAVRLMGLLAYNEDPFELAIGKRQVVQLLTDALPFASNTRQRSDIFLLRSECRLMFGDLALAGDDAHAALVPMNLRSIAFLKRIVSVFLCLGRYDDAALAYDTGLQQYPGNRQLLEGKKRDLEGWAGDGAGSSTDWTSSTRVGLYQHELWANVDLANLADGEESSLLDWKYPPPELRGETTNSDATDPDNAVGELAAEEEEEALTANAIWPPLPTDPAYVMVEFALGTEPSLAVSPQDISLPVDSTSPVESCLEAKPVSTQGDDEVLTVDMSGESVEEEEEGEEEQETSLETTQAPVEACPGETLQTSADREEKPLVLSTSPGPFLLTHVEPSETPISTDRAKERLPDCDRPERLYGVENSLRVGCFHALLDVFRTALAAFIVEQGPPIGLSEQDHQQFKTLPKAGLKVLMQFVKDHWATHFHTTVLPASFLPDLKTVTHVQYQSLYSGVASKETYGRGIQGVERLLAALAVGDETVRRVDMIKKAMGTDLETFHEDLDKTSHEDTASRSSLPCSNAEKDKDQRRTKAAAAGVHRNDGKTQSGCAREDAEGSTSITTRLQQDFSEEVPSYRDSGDEERLGTTEKEDQARPRTKRKASRRRVQSHPAREETPVGPERENKPRARSSSRRAPRGPKRREERPSPPPMATAHVALPSG